MCGFEGRVSGFREKGGKIKENGQRRHLLEGSLLRYSGRRLLDLISSVGAHELWELELVTSSR